MLHLIARITVMAKRPVMKDSSLLSNLTVSGVEVIPTPPRSPNLNAYSERFVRSITEECLNRIIFFSKEQFREAVPEHLEHYHMERNHQGFGNKLIEPTAELADTEGQIDRESRVGGMLNHHRRAA